jgi:hypothetical protein
MTSPTLRIGPGSPARGAASAVPAQLGEAVLHTSGAGAKHGPAHADAKLALASLTRPTPAPARGAGMPGQSLSPRSLMNPASAALAQRASAAGAWPGSAETRESLSAWASMGGDADQRTARRLAGLRIEQAVAEHNAVLDLRSNMPPHPAVDLLPALSTLPEVLRHIPGLRLTIDPATLEAMVPAFAHYGGLVSLTSHGVLNAPATLPPGLQTLVLDDSPGLVWPDTFAGYRQLHELSVKRCGLQSLPENMSELVQDFSELETYQTVDVRDNPLHAVPELMDDIRFLAKGDADMQRYARLRAPIGELTAEQLHQAVADLDRAVNELETEWGRNEAPHGVARFRKIDDQMHLGALVQSENALTPCLELTHTASEEALCSLLRRLVANANEQNTSGLNQPVTARVIAEADRAFESSALDDLLHTVALEARVHSGPEGNIVSVVGFDSTSDTEFSSALLENASITLQQEGIDMRFDAYSLGTQSTPHGCAIFALSVAKKMQDAEGVLGEFHDAALKGPFAAGVATPLAFYKHATSAGVLRRLRAVMGTDQFDHTPVNGRAQTLQERTSAGRTSALNPVTGGSRVMNVSYLAKRIQFYQRACHVYQQEARHRGLAIEPGIRLYPSVPTSSVLPLLQAMQERASSPE